MEKKKILTMTLAVGLSTAVVFGNSTEYILSSIADTTVVQKIGDVNNDNIIDATDSASILAEYVNLSINGKGTFSDAQKKSADINKDGVMDSIDASGILAYYTYTSTGGKLSIEEWNETIQGESTTTTTTSATTTSATTTSATTTSATATSTTATTSATETSTTTTTSTTTVTTETTTTVTVTTPKISDIRLTKYDIDIPVGGKDISYVVMYPENAPDKGEIWTSSDETIAKVDSLGYITGVSEGDCIVTVTSTDNPSVKAEIKVKVCTSDSRAEEIKLSKYNMNLSVGGRDVSEVSILPETVKNKNVVWTTSDMNIASVTIDGTVTGISEGTCVVTVTSVDNPKISADINVTVSSAGKINEIILSKYKMNILVGGKDISYVTMLPESIANKNEIWTSSDENVAVVDYWGNVTGISAGTCTVTVASEDNPSIKAEIKVTVSSGDKINEIRLSKTEMEISVGGKDISYVTMLPECVANKNEIWTSSDENVAIVDSWGNVTGISEGTCTITVTSVDNPEVKADIKVTVKKNPQSNFQQINGLTYINGILIANKSYSLPSTYDPGMDATTVKQFGMLSNAASKEGLNIYLSSGYRSYSNQSVIYNNYVSWYGKAVADTFSARAGNSEHQTGLAIDVNSIDDSFAGTPEALWLEKHAHEFGFIIRYPKGKENITGYKYEPWHIRYLGVEKATDVYNSGLTLEEYLGIDSYYH